MSYELNIEKKVFVVDVRNILQGIEYLLTAFKPNHQSPIGISGFYNRNNNNEMLAYLDGQDIYIQSPLTGKMTKIKYNHQDDKLKQMIYHSVVRINKNYKYNPIWDYRNPGLQYVHASEKAIEIFIEILQYACIRHLPSHYHKEEFGNVINYNIILTNIVKNHFQEYSQSIQLEELDISDIIHEDEFFSRLFKIYKSTISIIPSNTNHYFDFKYYSEQVVVVDYGDYRILEWELKCQEYYNQENEDDFSILGDELKTMNKFTDSIFSELKHSLEN